MEIEFEKWHGNRNDFIVFWVEKRQDHQLYALINQGKELCSRAGGGIGADGVLIIGYDKTKSESKDLELHIVNSDGTIARTCGNGIRCAAASVLKRFHFQQRPFAELEAVDFKLQDRTVTVQFLNPLKASESFRVPLMAVEMGEAKVNASLDWYAEAKDEVKRALSRLDRKLQVQDIGACEIGNKHLVIFCDNLASEAIYELGPALQKSKLWDGINVHLAESYAFEAKTLQAILRILPLDQEEMIRASVWERGAGPTQACGSGACAIAACAYDLGRNERKGWLTIRMPGGDLFVKQDDVDEPCLLAGFATFVFSGTLTI